MRYPPFQRLERRIPDCVVGYGFLLLIVLLCSDSLFSQNTVTGAFQGRVADNVTDQTIPGAKVTIRNEKTGTEYELITDSRGEFYQGHLAPGSYLITIESPPDYRSKQILMPLNITRTGEVIPVPVALEKVPPGAATTPAPPTDADDNIRVEINTTDARRDDSYPEKKIAVLPLGSQTVTRTPDELAFLSPGVAPPPQTIGDVAGPGVGPGVGSAGQFAVNGIRSRANNFTVDGSDNNDEDIGVRRQGFVALTSQPIESIQEFQITTLLAPAQFGRNIGAQVNIVSKTGGDRVDGTLYGYFNSNRLNARNYFDTIHVPESFPLRSESNQPVFVNNQPLIVRNNSAGEDPLTIFQVGGTIGGPISGSSLFYFLSGEYQKINASEEKHFSVPTIEQRGAFRTGTTGVFRNPFSGANLTVPVVPNSIQTAAIFSLFPFPNDADGIYGDNTFTKVLPASGRGVILSARLDNDFSFGGKPQSVTGRYNFTDDFKEIPAVNEAIFASVRPETRTHNFSFFLNSELSDSASSTQMLNQIRFSFGHTRLNFEEIRDTEFLVPSESFPDTPFLLNVPARFNTTIPSGPGQPNTGAVSFIAGFQCSLAFPVCTSEQLRGPIGQVKLAGFSSLGTDVYNFPQLRTNTTYQIADEFSIRTGRQVIVLGTDIRRTILKSDLARLSRPLLAINGSPRFICVTTPCTGIQNVRPPTQSDGNNNPIIRPEDLLGLGSASDFMMTFNVDRPDSKADLRFYQFNFYGQDTWRATSELSLSFGLRYEFNTPVEEKDGLIEETFSDDRIDLVQDLDRFIGGRTQLYEPDYNNFAPRVGIAWAPGWLGGSRVNVFRAGYGIFYDQILGAVANQSRNVFPTFVTLNFGGLNGTTLQNLLLFNPGRTLFLTGQGQAFLNSGGLNVLNPAVGLAEIVAAQSGASAFFPNAISVTLPSRDLPMPMAHHFNATFEHQLTANFAVSLAYVGTRGQNLLRFETPNLGSSLTIIPTTMGTGCLQPVAMDGSCPGNTFFPVNQGFVRSPNRVGPNLGAVSLFTTTAESTYNSLQTQIRGRFVDRFDFQASYTFSNVEDDVSDVFDLAGAFALPQDSFDLDAERGPANFDVRHRVAYSIIYDFGDSLKDLRSLNWITRDLRLASSGMFHSGQPFTVNSVVDVNLDGNLTDRLNTTVGLVETGNGRQPLIRQADPFSFLAPFGENGSIGRNTFRAGKFFTVDVSAIKQISFGPGRLSLRADIFNLLNRANFGVPVRLLEAAGFGLATKTLIPARRIQFAVKYAF